MRSLHRGSVGERLVRLSMSARPDSMVPRSSGRQRWAAKTVNRKLTSSETAIYSEWIENYPQERALIAEMREIAAKAQHIMLEEISEQDSPRMSRNLFA